MLPSQIVAIVALSVSVVCILLFMWLTRTITHPKESGLDMRQMDSEQFFKFFHRIADESAKRKADELA